MQKYIVLYGRKLPVTLEAPVKPSTLTGKAPNEAEGTKKPLKMSGVLSIKDTTEAAAPSSALPANVYEVKAETVEALVTAVSTVYDLIGLDIKQIVIVSSPQRKDEVKKALLSLNINYTKQRKAGLYVTFEHLQTKEDLEALHEIKATTFFAEDIVTEFASTYDLAATSGEREAAVDCLKAELEDLAFRTGSDYSAEAEIVKGFEAALRLLPEDKQKAVTFTTKQLLSYLHSRKEREAEAARKEDFLNFAKYGVTDIAKKDNVAELRKAMQEHLDAYRSTGFDEELFEDFVTPSSPEDFEASMKGKEGLKTGLTLLADGEALEVEIPEGVSLLCGARKHGKTTLLLNILLNEAKKNVADYKAGRTAELRRVLFYSYEVPKKRVWEALLSIFVNDEAISSNTRKSIAGFFNGQGAKYFATKEGEHNSKAFDNFLKAYNAFFVDYIKSGAVIVIDNNYKVERLISSMQALTAAYEVSLIGIDYIQEIYSEAKAKAQRTEELKYIGTKLREFANPLSLPILCAAQFNRINSFLDVTTNNIGEAGDLERNAMQILGIYNLKELTASIDELNITEILRTSILYGVEPTALLRSSVNTKGKRQWNLKPVYGKLYIKLMASRVDVAPAEVVVDFKGTTGFIDIEGSSEVVNKAKNFPPDLKEEIEKAKAAIEEEEGREAAAATVRKIQETGERAKKEAAGKAAAKEEERLKKKGLYGKQSSLIDEEDEEEETTKEKLPF